MKKRIFLDWAAGENNPSAIYKEGVLEKKKLLEARIRISRNLGCASQDIIFTSGGTESDNLAILGVFEALKRKIKKPHIIIGALEHSAVEKSAKEAKRRGARLSILPVNSEGLLKLEELNKLLTPKTILISIALVDSELGVIQNIGKAGKIIRECRKKNNTSYPYLHTDASQAFQLTGGNIESLKADLMTLDGGKINAGRSSGLLVVRPNVEIMPIIFGGSQQRLRAGTENVSNASNLADAISNAIKSREKENKRLEAVEKYFRKKVLDNFPGAVILGSQESKVPSVLSIAFPGILGEFIDIKLDREGIMVGTGNACESNSDTPKSKGARALGREDLSESVIRFSFGKSSRKSEINQTIKALIKVMPSK